MYLTVTDKVHVKRHGTFVTTPDLEEELKHSQAQAYKEPKITDILLDGKSILGRFSAGTASGHEYAVELPTGATAPSLTGTGTAMTVVPAVSGSSPARLIACSEDGEKTSEYRVYCRKPSETERL